MADKKSTLFPRRNRLATILKRERERGGGIGSALLKRGAEKFDPRNFFDQSGFLAEAFPSMFKAYRATPNTHQYSGSSRIEKDINNVDVDIKILTSKIDELKVDSKTSAKNSMYLPKMGKDINIMSKNVSKIVKATNQKPTIVADKFFQDSAAREREYEAKYDVEKKGIQKSDKTKAGTPEKSKGGLLSGLFGGLTKGFNIASIGVGIGGFLAGIGAGAWALEKFGGIDNIKKMLIGLGEGLKAFDVGGLVALGALLAGGVLFSSRGNPVSTLNAAAGLSTGMGAVGLGLGGFLSGLALGGAAYQALGGGSGVKDMLTSLGEGLKSFDTTGLLALGALFTASAGIVGISGAIGRVIGGKSGALINGALAAGGIVTALTATGLGLSGFFSSLALGAVAYDSLGGNERVKNMLSSLGEGLKTFDAKGLGILASVIGAAGAFTGVGASIGAVMGGPTGALVGALAGAGGFVGVLTAAGLGVSGFFVGLSAGAALYDKLGGQEKVKSMLTSLGEGLNVFNNIKGDNLANIGAGMKNLAEGMAGLFKADLWEGVKAFFGKKDTKSLLSELATNLKTLEVVDGKNLYNIGSGLYNLGVGLKNIASLKETDFQTIARAMATVRNAPEKMEVPEVKGSVPQTTPPVQQPQVKQPEPVQTAPKTVPELGRVEPIPDPNRGTGTVRERDNWIKKYGSTHNYDGTVKNVNNINTSSSSSLINQIPTDIRSTSNTNNTASLINQIPTTTRNIPELGRVEPIPDPNRGTGTVTQRNNWIKKYGSTHNYDGTVKNVNNNLTNASLINQIPTDIRSTSNVNNTASLINQIPTDIRSTSNTNNTASLINQIPTTTPKTVPELTNVKDVTDKGLKQRGEMTSVAGAVIHHTGGNSSEGAIRTLKANGFAYHYMIEKDGSILKLLPDKTVGFHGGKMQGGLTNNNSIGISLVARDDKDITKEQIASAKLLNENLAQKYGYDPKAVWGHGEVSPDRKQATEGLTVVKEIRGEEKPRSIPEMVAKANENKPTTPEPVKETSMVKSAVEKVKSVVSKVSDKITQDKKTTIVAKGNPNEAMKFFVSKGWTEEQAAGIVGNLQQESTPNLDPTSHNKKENAYGIAQWRGDRQKTFKKVFGKDIKDSTFQEQLEFVQYELMNTHQDAGKLLKQAKTPEEAAVVIDQHYEISKGLHTEERIKYAKALVGGGDYQVSKTEEGTTTSPSKVPEEEAKKGEDKKKEGEKPTVYSSIKDAIGGSISFLNKVLPTESIPEIASGTMDIVFGKNSPFLNTTKNFGKELVEYIKTDETTKQVLPFIKEMSNKVGGGMDLLGLTQALNEIKEEKSQTSGETNINVNNVQPKQAPQQQMGPALAPAPVADLDLMRHMFPHTWNSYTNY